MSRNASRKTVLASLASMCAVCAMVVPTMPAQADTLSKLNDARNQYAESTQREADLKSQLSSVSAELKNKILELDDLTNNKIVAAQAKVEAANVASANAQSAAEAAASRLEAAQKDLSDLEAQIEQTGADYDDAHAAVAQLAREEMHGSDASDIMSVVTGAADTEDFVTSMQTHDALSRIESNVASNAADELSTSMNRSERLKAIEAEVAALKVKADQASAEAQAAATSAQSERDALDKLREQGEALRDELSSQVSSLDSEVAQQAAQSVLLESQIDSYNRQYQKEQAEAAARVEAERRAAEKKAAEEAKKKAEEEAKKKAAANNNNNSNNSSNSGTTTNTNSGTNTNTNSGTTTNTNSGTTGGQGTSYGDYGNRYASGQCTWWAYERRRQMGIGTPSYLGNGGDWYLNAPAYGLRVDHTPQVGAAISFLRGQDGADLTYGHVAVVEAVYSNGTFLISEMNWGGPWIMHYRTLTNYGQYWFTH